jgi:hypothetical protein
MRVLAAVCPLEIHLVTAAVTRSRRFRGQRPLSDADLAAGLTAFGCNPASEDHGTHHWRQPHQTSTGHCYPCQRPESDPSGR